MVSLKRDQTIYCTGVLVSDKDIISSATCISKTKEFQKKEHVKETAIYIQGHKYEIGRQKMHSLFKSCQTANTHMYNIGHIEVSFLNTVNSLNMAIFSILARAPLNLVLTSEFGSNASNKASTQ